MPRMQAMVESNFGEIKNHKAAAPSFSDKPLTENELQKMYKLVPIKVAAPAHYIGIADGTFSARV